MFPQLRGFRVPKAASMVVTLLQTLQMVVGVTVTVYSLVAKSNGVECSVKTSHIYSSLLMYAAFLYLFVDFFRKAYIVPRNKKLD